MADVRPSSSEQEIVSVAIRQLPADIKERIQKLFDEGLLKEGDLDLRSITVFASLNEGLQARVMNHMEGERIYVANARSKSGFLIATCDKAKSGCLDARGLGAIDPWRSALVAMATPKRRQVDLKPERDWLEKQGESAVIKIQVDLGSTVEAELGVPSVTVELPLTETSSAIKAKLVAMGVKALPQNKMMLHEGAVGFMKDRHTFAYYNLKDGTACVLSQRKRAGSRFRADHTVLPKRPKTERADSAAAPPATAPAAAPATAPAPAPGAAPNPLDVLRNMTAAGAKMPAMPQMPTLPGAAGTLPAAGGPAGLPGALLGNMFGGKMPAMPSLPGMTMPNLLGGAPAAGAAVAPPKLGAFPGLPGFSMPAPALGGSITGVPGVGALGAMGAPKASPPGLTMPGFAKTGGGMPGFQLPGADAKGGGLSFMAKTPGTPAGFPGMLPPPMTKGGGMPVPPPAATGSTPKGGPN